MAEEQDHVVTKNLALKLTFVLGIGLLIMESLRHGFSNTDLLLILALVGTAWAFIVYSARSFPESPVNDQDASPSISAPLVKEPDPLPSASSAIVAALPDPVLLIDDKYHILEANPAAQTVLPLLKARQALSLTLRAPDILKGIEQVQQTGEPVIVEYQDPSPTKRMFEIRMALATQTPRTVVMLMRDVTEARRIQNMRTDFIANASHELRTPLASMLGFIETLQGPARNDSKARDKFLIIMRDQALRMKRLINDLLSLSRIEMKEHVVPQDNLDLSPLVQEVLEALQPLAQEYGANIQYKPLQKSAHILGDRDELTQVFQNLVENAIKYGGGEIKVTLACHASTTVFSVHDQGHGIEAEHIPRLTERFYRVNSDYAPQREGTGLGLAIAKHIINRHRASLTVESQLGKGSCFSVSFPALNDR
jgi:two-component system, OmpR family, phosphate regulon sensor histidine kinase PhoR